MEENLKQLPANGKEIIKIAILGPDNSGKTTLSKQLADYYDATWIPDFASEYRQNIGSSSSVVTNPADLMSIAIGQVKLENEALLVANKHLFSDTCLLNTKVFSEIHYKFCEPTLDKAARKHKYDLFFLTDISSDIEGNLEERKAILETFRQALIENKKPFIVLSGSEESRLQKAIQIVDELTKALAMGFNTFDFLKILDERVELDVIYKQLNIFKNGTVKTILDRPAIINDGILHLSESEFAEYANYFDSNKERLKLKKFIPSSGAASRMFQFLNEFLNNFDSEHETINSYVNRNNAGNLNLFIVGMEKLPFYDAIIEALISLFPDYDSWNDDTRNYHFIKVMLDSAVFDYANKPKGVLSFHKYEDHIATPIEEHLNEGVSYASSGGNAYLHFTISEAHEHFFTDVVNTVKNKIEAQSGVKLHIDFSYQKKETDTIAVNSDNTPFRDNEGRIVFRPGGHGALIENLNELDADIIFIKNIDNVIQNHIEFISLHKKGLAGVLVEMQRRIFDYLEVLDQCEEENIKEIVDFAHEKLNINISSDFDKYTLTNKINYLKEKLHRPIRVCGMVQNEGEPGGGPFWVSDTKGGKTLQIVESSQIDQAVPSQNEIAKMATHFNPVDLVCGIKDYKGDKFDLTQYIDQDSGFIVEKSKWGKNIKSYELPGLWNGAMSDWITIFVEVPLITFNPVKTVNDLLKSPHQKI
jgi:nicotinamide riboside kinase